MVLLSRMLQRYGRLAWKYYSFFVSGLTPDNELEAIPRYYATTHAGDALWLPTWTWHRVDYRMRGIAAMNVNAKPMRGCRRERQQALLSVLPCSICDLWSYSVTIHSLPSSWYQTL